MRTTIDLPEAKHRQLKAIAERRAISLGALITELTDLALSPKQGSSASRTLAVSPRTGLLTLSLGRPISSDEVAALMDLP